MPVPQASLTWTTMSFGACSGARGMAKADDAKTRASEPIIHLIICFPSYLTTTPPSADMMTRTETGNP